MIWVYIYLFIGTFIAAISMGMIEKKLKLLTVIGSLIVIFFWPWILFFGIGKGLRKRE